MKRQDLHELHYITPISNVTSIMSHGILSHKRAKKLHHDSVASERIQNRRTRKVVPGGKPLHDYVNLYINARNKMLYSIKVKHTGICVLGIKVEILDLPGVVVSDRNASCNLVRFAPAPSGLRIVDGNLVFARYWTVPNDPIEEWRRGSITCAEALVPDRVDPNYIISAYVSCNQARTAFEATGVKIPVTINAYLFFM